MAVRRSDRSVRVPRRCNSRAETVKGRGSLAAGSGRSQLCVRAAWSEGLGALMLFERGD